MGMYKGIRKAVSPVVRKTDPIKSATGVTLTGLKELMNQWGVLLWAVLHKMCGRSQSPKWSEMPPNHAQIGQWTQHMWAGGSASCTGHWKGTSRIPPEVLKCLKGPCLRDMHDILIQYWRAGTVPTGYETQISSHCIKTKMKEVTATTIVLPPCSVSQESSLLVLSKRDCKSLWTEYIQSLSVVSVQSAQWSTWSSLLDNYKRTSGGTEETSVHCFYWPHESLWFCQQRDCSRSSTVLGALPIFSVW